MELDSKEIFFFSLFYVKESLWLHNKENMGHKTLIHFLRGDHRICSTVFGSVELFTVF